MNPYFLTSNFLLQNSTLTWNALQLGYERGYIGWAQIAEIAAYRASHEGDSVSAELMKLALIDKESAHTVDLELHQLAASEIGTSVEASEQIWLFLQLAWLRSNVSNFDDPLGEVEKIYADFDYPENVADFVRYMPASTNYDPASHSFDENNQRLFQMWDKYLASMRPIFPPEILRQKKSKWAQTR